jgi:hypothetical protein
MRHLVLTVLLVALLLVPAGAAKPAPRLDAGSGISLVLPAGWHVVHRQISDCSDPVQRFAAASRGTTVLLLETNMGRFPLRTARFRLPAKLSTFEGCCNMPNGPGVELLFRDHGRRFYAFVYLGRHSRDRPAALSLLNSLRISPAF